MTAVITRVSSLAGLVVYGSRGRRLRVMYVWKLGAVVASTDTETDSDYLLFCHALFRWMVNSLRHTESNNGKLDSDSRYYSVLSFLPVVEIRMSFSLAEGCRAFV